MARVPVELDDADIAKAAKAIKAIDDDEPDSRRIDAVLKVVKGISVMMAARLVYAAEVKNNPRLRIKPANAKNIEKARTPVSEGGQGMRWERIAARTDMSVLEVKNVLLEAGIDPDDTYTGRGAKGGNGGNSKSAAKKTTAEKKPVGRPKKAEAAAKPGMKVRKRQGLKPRPSRT